MLELSAVISAFRRLSSWRRCAKPHRERVRGEQKKLLAVSECVVWGMGNAADVALVMFVEGHQGDVYRVWIVGGHLCSTLEGRNNRKMSLKYSVTLVLLEYSRNYCFGTFVWCRKIASFSKRYKGKTGNQRYKIFYWMKYLDRQSDLRLSI